MSYSTLGIGVSALTAAQRAVETAAHNVANSSVEGYTRQRLSISAAPPGAGTAGLPGSGMRGTGVRLMSVDRLRDAIADVAVRSEASSAGTAGARAGVLDRAQGILGPYGGGLPASLSTLWRAFDQLAVTPSSPAARQLTLDAAAALADGLRGAAGELDQIRSDTFSALRDTVSGVNAAAQEIAGLNRQIADALVGGQAPNDLLDRRDLLLDKLATVAGATSTVRPGGMVDVRIGGEVLVDGVSTSPMELSEVPVEPPAAGADPAVTVGGRPVQAGGVLSGGVAALAIDLREFETQLDGLAAAVATAVNGQQALGFDAAGAPGQPIFVGSGARDLAVSDAMRPGGLAASANQVEGGSPHDGENAVALARLRAPGPDGVSLGDRLTGLAALLGTRAASASRAADAADASLEGVRQQRDAVHGVSVDEEMVDLVKFQHAYDAAARVISIADQMLDTIINGLGVGR